MIIRILSILWLICFLLFGFYAEAYPQDHSDSNDKGELWELTAYCPCSKCCGKYSNGITASGKKAKYGMVACNWLPFGQRIEIEGMGIFVVADRGAKSLFGDKNNHIKHLDIFMNTHNKAMLFGKKNKRVKILDKRREI